MPAVAGMKAGVFSVGMKAGVLSVELAYTHAARVSLQVLPSPQLTAPCHTHVCQGAWLPWICNFHLAPPAPSPAAGDTLEQLLSKKTSRQKALLLNSPSQLAATLCAAFMEGPTVFACASTPY